MDDLRKALEALAKETDLIGDVGTSGNWVSKRIRAILAAYPPEPAEGTGLREAFLSGYPRELRQAFVGGYEWEANKSPLHTLSEAEEEARRLYPGGGVHPAFQSALGMVAPAALTSPAPDGGLREAWDTLRPWVINLSDALSRTDVKRDDGKTAAEVVSDCISQIDAALRAQPPKETKG